MIDPRTPDGAAVLCYDNAARAAGTGYTASSVDGDNVAANAFDGLTWDYWRATSAGTHSLTVALPATAAAQYIGIAGHNLAGGSFRFKGSPDGVSTVDLLPGVSKLVTSNAPICVLLPAAVSYPFYSIEVTQAAEAPQLGVVSFGSILPVQRGIHDGFTPPPDAVREDYTTNESAGGLFLGRSVSRVTNDLDVNLTYLTRDWVRRYWRPFADAVATEPFFFVWDRYRYPSEVFFGYSTKRPVPQIMRGQFMQAQLTARGVA